MGKITSSRMILEGEVLQKEISLNLEILKVKEMLIALAYLGGSREKCPRVPCLWKQYKHQQHLDGRSHRPSEDLQRSLKGLLMSFPVFSRKLKFLKPLKRTFEGQGIIRRPSEGWRLPDVICEWVSILLGGGGGEEAFCSLGPDSAGIRITTG